MEIYVLVEDRRWNNEDVQFCTIGTENDCLRWILDHTSFSFSLALKEGGYKLIEVK